MNKKCFMNVMFFLFDMFLMIDSTNDYLKCTFLILGAISLGLAVNSYKDKEEK